MKHWIRKNITLRNLFLFFIPVFIAILIAMLYNLSTSVEHLSISLIRETSEEVNLQVNRRFESVTSMLKSTGNWKYESPEEILNPEEMNNLFIPMLKFSDQVSSMMIATADGSEYMLLELDGYWSNRITRSDADGLSSMRYRWEYHPRAEDILLERWRDTSGYDPRTRIWFQGALQQKAPQQIFWTPPYTFFTTREPGITISMYSFTRQGDTLVTAYDLLLKDINRITQSLELTPNGLALILTAEDFRAVGLPSTERFMQQDTAEAYILSKVKDLDIQVLTASLEHWESIGRTTGPHELKFMHETWWAGYYPVVSETGQTILYIALLVPESDFLSEMNRTRLVILFGFILVLTLTILVIRAYSQVYKTNRLLEEKNTQIAQQNRAIEAKNKEITDSIHYAERIQSAILPQSDRIRSLFPESFVLFLPKDIVSGDFYWVEETDDNQLIAAVDCTGHGVPGAFVSMVGSGGLNSAIKEYGLKDTASILRHLNRVITDTFRQSSEASIKDGMDLAICALNRRKRTLEYAGAKNPLYLVRSGSDALVVDGQIAEPVMEEQGRALYEIRADRTGIEPRADLPKFNTHMLTLAQGDMVYLFSDGYADQFGGPKNKKFTYKRLKRTFISISGKSAAEQEEHLLNTFIEWKVESEQIDDVLVIGFRIRD